MHNVQNTGLPLTYLRPTHQPMGMHVIHNSVIFMMSGETANHALKHIEGHGRGHDVRYANEDSNVPSNARRT